MGYRQTMAMRKSESSNEMLLISLATETEYSDYIW